MKDKNVFQSPLGNAARKEQQQLLSKLLAVGAEDFLRTAPIKKETKGLHLNCGDGTLSLLMANLIGPKGQLIGIDPEKTLIENAQKMAMEQDGLNLQFYTDEAFQQLKNTAHHFVFGRYLFSQLSSYKTEANCLFQLLQPNGLLLLEDLDLRKMNCFPYSYAFERFRELIKELYKRQGLSTVLGSSIEQQLLEAGFQQIQIKFQTPLFLKNNSKQLASLSFEAVMAAILKQRLASTSEIHALLMELKAYEREEQTMISLPGIYQIKAYRL